MEQNPAAQNNSETPEEIDKIPVEKMWDQIGFHKPLAGFWFGLGFKLISLVLTIVISGMLINYFYPFPESAGYRSAATGIFSLFFTIMDLGTHMTMDRYIAEARIKDPKKMIKYIQYFIWYQMTTGLVQTTAVSLYALYFVPRTELSYAIWLMLICSTYQYPGWLGVFGGVLGSLQHYNKTEVLGFITGEVFQRITELSFVFVGRIYGAAHPEIGEIMGIAIGAMIGTYVDDFFATALSAYYFTKVMKGEGITARTCFGHDFDWPLVKECLIFGIKTGLPSLIGLISSLIMLWEFIIYIPQYTTFATLSGLASGIAGMINWSAGAGTSIMAEAYMNGKKRLTQYYLTQTIRYAALFQGFLTSLLLAVSLVLNRAFETFEMTNYILAIPFIIPWVIRHLQQPYTSLCDTVMLGTNHPTTLMYIRFLEECIKIVSMTLWIVVLQLPRKYGISAMIWIFPCGEYIAILTKTIFLFSHIHRNIVKIQVAWWQTLVVPIVSGGIVYAIDYCAIIFVLNPLDAAINFYVAAAVTIAILILVINVYFALTAYLGGWDKDSLREFEKAALMSGPSKSLVMPMYKCASFFAARSKLTGKFSVSSLDAEKEARELLALKHAHSFKENII